MLTSSRTLVAALVLALAAPVATAAAAPPAPGSIVAIYSPERQRYLRLGDDGAVTTIPAPADGTTPANGSRARFRVIDGGAGAFAFQGVENRRFLRLTSDGKVNAADPVDALPAGWPLERLNLKNRADGALTIWSPAVGRALRMFGDGAVGAVMLPPTAPSVPGFGPPPPAPIDGLAFTFVPLPPQVGEGIIPLNNCPSGAAPFVNVDGKVGCRKLTEVRALEAGKRFVIALTDPLVAGAAVPGPYRLVAPRGQSWNVLALRAVTASAPLGILDVFVPTPGLLAGTFRLVPADMMTEVAVGPDGAGSVVEAGRGDLFRVVDAGGVLSLVLVRPIVRTLPASSASDVATVETCLAPAAVPYASMPIAQGGLAAFVSDQLGAPLPKACGARTWFRVFEVGAPTSGTP